MNEITHALRAVRHGQPRASDRLLELVYAELRRIAAGKLAGERPGQTLQPTALVHEAWLQLGGEAQPAWQNRRHFYGAAAEAMRRVLIDRARRRLALRRGGGHELLDIDEAEIASPVPDNEMVALDEALERLARTDPRKAELVNLRYFVGLTIEDTAAAMEISTATAKRWWLFARAWLHRELLACE